MLPGIGALVDSGLILGGIALPNNQRTAGNAQATPTPPLGPGQEATARYLASLGPPSTSSSPAADFLTYEVERSVSSGLPLPSPEQAWLERDVDHHNWSAFLAQLADNNGDRGTQMQILEQWNAAFFRPRRCCVTMASSASPPAAGAVILQPEVPATTGAEDAIKTETLVQIKEEDGSGTGVTLLPGVSGPSSNERR